MSWIFLRLKRQQQKKKKKILSLNLQILVNKYLLSVTVTFSDCHPVPTLISVRYRQTVKKN